MEENTFEGAIKKITSYTADTRKGPAKAYRLQVNGDEFSGWGEPAIDDRYLVEGVVRGRFEVNRGFKNILENTLVLVRPVVAPGVQTDLHAGSPKPGAQQGPVDEAPQQILGIERGGKIARSLEASDGAELRVRCEGLQAAGLDSPQPVIDYALEFEKHLRGGPRH